MIRSTQARVGSRGRRVLAMLALAVLLFPAAAFAWAQDYAFKEYFGPGGIHYSAANASLIWNETKFVTSGNGDRMQLTLCTTSYECYPYRYSTSGWLGDDRSISYGRAKCNAWQANYNYVWVEWCTVAN